MSTGELRWQLSLPVGGGRAGWRSVTVWVALARPLLSESRPGVVVVGRRVAAGLVGFAVHRVIGGCGASAAASRRDLDERLRPSGG